MKNIFAAFTLALLVVTSSPSYKMPEGKSLLSSFCQFSVSDQLMQTSISFSEVYTFTVDQNGKALGVKRVSGNYLDLQEVTTCIRKWEFSGFAPNSRVTVSFAWKHGEGWTEMKVISKDFIQTTLLGKQSCS